MLEKASLLSRFTVPQLTGAQRHKGVVRARWALMVALHLRGWSTVQIGRLLGRDHTTIMYGLKQADSGVQAMAALLCDGSD
jgi:chromosomal replication initiation ATPase DnaA